MKAGDLKQFAKDMKNGVYDFTDNGKCTSCGECCSNMLPMTKEEIQIIKKYKRKHHIQDTSYDANVGFNFICPFRDNSRKICTIYEVRPAICKDFKCDKPAKGIKVSSELSRAQRKVIMVRETFFSKEAK